MYTNYDRRLELSRETMIRLRFKRLQQGVLSLFQCPQKTIIMGMYLIIAIEVWMSRADIFSKMKISIFEPLSTVALGVLIIVAMLMLLHIFGTPWGSNRMHNDLYRAGLINKGYETPLLLKISKDEKNPKIKHYDFDANGVPLCDFEENVHYIEVAMNIVITDIRELKDKRHIRVSGAKGQDGLKRKYEWNNQYLSSADFKLALGVKAGELIEYIDLRKLSHVLLGGSTNSGKTTALRSILRQAIYKRACVVLADFKFGIDYSRWWRNNAVFTTNKRETVRILKDIVAETERRANLFLAQSNDKFLCNNIGKYNALMEKQGSPQLPRIIFACDELSELLSDRKNASAEDKAMKNEIEGLLSTIARTARALGIHLILAGQRITVDTLSNEVKANIDYRVCFRADDTLSKVIVDHTEASDIPKYMQGRCVNHEKTQIQCFYTDED